MVVYEISWFTLKEICTFRFWPWLWNLGFLVALIILVVEFGYWLDYGEVSWLKFDCMITGQEEEKLRLLWFGVGSCLIDIISLQMGCVRC